MMVVVFNLIKWVSNLKFVMDGIDLDKRVMLLLVECDLCELFKVFGVLWDLIFDCFRFIVLNESVLFFDLMMKRSFLSLVLRMFDLMGLIFFFIVRVKIFF